MYIGEIAALLTAGCWSVNSILFSDAGRKIGSRSVNHLRMWLALLFLVGIQWVAYQQPLPVVTPSAWMFLALSGIIGFSAGDALLFEAYVLIGPRMGMLMMTTVPVFSVGLGWMFLGEKLGIRQLVAVFITVVGIAMVIREKIHRSPDWKTLRRGALLGLGGALGQAVGLLFSKKGMLEGVQPISANLIRVLAAVVVISLLRFGRGQFFRDFAKFRQPGIGIRITGGALFGPVLGVVLSLVAVLNAHMGIASTLMSLSPVFLIPLSRLIYREYISPGTVFWTLVAIAGAGWLFFL
jgi:drug/metabolite transporter (DMT)-like permease